MKWIKLTLKWKMNPIKCEELFTDIRSICAMREAKEIIIENSPKIKYSVDHVI